MMKRSEMISLLVDALGSTGLTYYNNGYYDKADHVEAESMLDAVERAGMLPPPDYLTPLAIDGSNGIVLEVHYNHGPASNPEKGIYQGWENE